MLLVTDDDYLPVLMKLLDHARKSVDVIAYSFAIGSAGGKISFSGAPFQIAQKLGSLKKKGVRVRVYMEGTRETSERNLVTARFLKKAKIEVKYGATHDSGRARSCSCPSSALAYRTATPR